jgi:hypothetical protein
VTRRRRHARGEGGSRTGVRHDRPYGNWRATLVGKDMVNEWLAVRRRQDTARRDWIAAMASAGVAATVQSSRESDGRPGMSVKLHARAQGPGYKPESSVS